MEDSANDGNEQYILGQIRTWVWSGYYSPAEVYGRLGDILEDEVDEDRMCAAVEEEFEKKRAAEASWPLETDCDRLDAAFAALDCEGILALQNAGYTMSDGHEDAAEALSTAPPDKYFGYCFFHGQDLERAVAGDGLCIAFDHVRGDVPEKADVGQKVKQALEHVGFRVEWNGSASSRLNIPGIDWKRRGAR